MYWINIYNVKNVMHAKMNAFFKFTFNNALSTISHEKSVEKIYFLKLKWHMIKIGAIIKLDNQILSRLYEDE